MKSRKLTERTCEYCRKAFLGFRADHKYCSKKCRSYATILRDIKKREEADRG